MSNMRKSKSCEMNSLAIDFGEAADATNPPNSSSSSSLPAVMRRFALFVDGMTRAMILPFGPTLVHRLVYGQTEIRPATWSGVAYYLGWVVAVYILGGWLGNVMSQHLIMSKDRLPIVIARLGGAALSLQIFTYGAGLASVRGLAAIRFVSAILAGLLCGVTVSIPLPEDDWIYRHGEKSTSDEETADALRRREGYVDIASGTAKIYLTGFAVSILSGGLLFRKATKDATFQALTGAYQYTWSPLFLIGVAVTAEIILRGLFALARNPNATENEGSGTAGRVRGVVRRMVSDVSQTTGRDVIVAIESLTSAHRSHAMSQAEFRPLMEEDDDDDQSNFVLHTENQLYFDADVATHATPARSRVESYTSIDEFFDCRSALSDLEEGERSIWPPLVADENEVACYVNGKCVYSDGSRACVPQGECVARLPPNYLAFYNHNQHKARRAWEETQKWRLEKGVWKIHTMPNTWFNKVKEAYPHFVHGHSKVGYPVVYEQPGRMNLKDLFRNGCQVSDMIMHYTFFMEYLSNHVCTREEIRCVLNGAQPLTSSSWGMMVVMDVKGAGLSHLSGDVVKYLKQAGDINSAHYPISMKRAFLVNSPFWLAGAWSGLKGMLPDSVHVDILSESKYPNALREFIDEDQIPPEYGGTSLYGLGSHPYELELRKLVDDVKDDETDLLMNIPQGSVLVDNAKDYDLRRDLPMNLPRGIIVPSEVDRRRGDFSSDVVFTQEKLKSLLSPYAKKTPPPLHPIRRRVSSIDQALRRNIRGVDFQTPSKTGSLNGHRDVFFIVSAMHVLWSFVQGAIEVAIPLWILSPTTMGGLGYSPSRTGVSFFCACLVLLWTLRTKPSKLVSKIPSKSPLRAFRIGAGSEAALLAMLAFVSTSTSPLNRNDSVFVMTSTVIIFASMALSTMIGRSASKILHRIASESFARRPKHQANNGSAMRRFAMSRLLSDCDTGRFTSLLNLVAEITGIFLVAPLWSLSISSERQAPCDGTCILLVASLITFVLYVCSFALHLNSDGEFAPHPNYSCTDTRWRRFVPFLCEVIAVSAGDMASLFEEANWSATPLLGRDRIRTYSETSALSFADMVMERGDGVSVGRKAM